MAVSDNREKMATKGQVRARSNVCVDPNASNLIPGDVLKRYGMHYDRQLSPKQKAEMDYYLPCAYCSRLLLQIMEGGCDRPICRQGGKIPSTAEAARRKRGLETPVQASPNES